MLPSGCVEVDAMRRTSLAGVHAAGDLSHQAGTPGRHTRQAHQAALPGPLASALSAAAARQVAAASLAAYLG